jgi:hypothetical protein
MIWWYKKGYDKEEMEENSSLIELREKVIKRISANWNSFYT